MTDGQRVVAPRRRKAAGSADEGPTDRQLLERFVARREESAFAALIGRHGPVVLGVCRRVLGNEQDAEDVFQATFLTLARKAAVVPWRESIAPWLRAVAGRLALQARSAALRRRSREAPLGPAADAEDGDQPGGWQGLPEKYHPHADPLAEVARRELRRVLDDELERLPEKYRAPVVLCYLEGKTNEEAAGELGWPTGSMSRRLARARALLQQRLSRRGLALWAVLLCLLLAAPWLRRPGPRPAAAVAEAMRRFRPVRAGGEGIESALLRLASNGAPPAGERPEDLLGKVDRTAQAATALLDHDPGRQRAEWRRLAEEMRRSADDLAGALADGEERTTLAAARRLTATCQRCHEVFRD
jgi:RNA polymerase sigma-70 factor (ECF subfamily)